MIRSECSSHGQMSSWCGTPKISTRSSRFPYPQPTFGFQTSSSTSCKISARVPDTHVLLCSVINTPPLICKPAAWMWGSLQTYLTSTWRTTGWCGTTNPSRWSRRARWTSTTSPSTCRSAAWPSRAGSTPVRPPACLHRGPVFELDSWWKPASGILRLGVGFNYVWLNYC